MLDRLCLHNYQKEVVSFILEHPYCGVFLDLGLGKTVSTLTAISDLMYDRLDIKSVLVVAPKRVAESVWEEEADKWSHLNHLTFSKIIGTADERLSALRKKADIHIISRDNVQWLCSIVGGDFPFDMIVADELSSFKNHTSKRFKALRAVRPLIKRFVGLTGTPAPNGLLDLWPQMYLIDRGERLGRTISMYRRLYFRPDKVNGPVVYSYKIIKGCDAVIQNKIKDICISMKSKDYLTLPDRIDNFLDLKMPTPVKIKYNNFVKEKVLELPDSDISAVNAVALTNKLLQFANGTIYDEEGVYHHVHNIKLEALKEIIDNANGKSVLVAYTFVSDKDRIKDYLKEYKPVELKTSKEVNDWNDGRIQVLLAHPASAGHGLNLQRGGSIIVWYGLTWSLELYQQFNARLYRQGQKEAVVINHLNIIGTVDSDVIRVIRSKDMTQEALLNSIKHTIIKYKSDLNNKK